MNESTLTVYRTGIFVSKPYGEAEKTVSALAGDAHHVTRYGWDCTQYSVTLSYGFKSITVDYFHGLGIKGAPSASGVLFSLAMDTRDVEEYGVFETWAEELGYDSDSITALRTFEDCQSNARKLHSLLGSDAYAIIDKIIEENA